MVFSLRLYVLKDGSPMETDMAEGEETEDYENVANVTELMQYNTEEDYMMKREENIDGKSMSVISPEYTDDLCYNDSICSQRSCC